MFIVMPEDNSIIRWKYKSEWKCAEISDLILAYEKQEKGEWIEDDNHNIVCPFCGGIRRDCRIDHINFCNRCGAKMT